MSRPILFIACFLVIALAIAGFFLPDSIRPKLEKISIEATSPVWRSLDWIKDKYVNIRAGFQTAQELRSQNHKLTTENAGLQTENAILRSLKEENGRLREMIGFKDDSNFQLLPARVIQRDPSNWWNVVIINRGWEGNPALASDQPVVSARGVVGKTGAVGRYASRVILLVDENCKISAVTETSHARGIVVGATSLSAGDPLCHITFVGRDSEFAVGERVFTTGLGGAFPPNLLIGTVKEAPPLAADKNFGLYRDGVIEPTVDLNNLEEVFVVTGVK
ncbi:MAG: rod shape-determining protein MreC [Methylacidiphilales bacterium]|nr:rod shape-determining protein MreC [Candidatus Methylacidiphilales bacterium]